MRHSTESERNAEVVEWSKEYDDQDNIAFFRDALAGLRNEGPGDLEMPDEAGAGDAGPAHVVFGLLGQRDLPGYTLRTAQSVLRWDIRPSLWSHVFLMAEPLEAIGDAGEARLLEVTLHPRTGGFPAAERNGVTEGHLGLYDDRNVDANVALLSVRMDRKQAGAVLERARAFNIDRVRYNLWQTLGIWQGYLWSQGDRPNPLRQGIPIAASSYVEMAFEAIRLDLTPGASERNSAPEHLWNAAIWWSHPFKDQRHPIRGYYVLRDKGCSMLDATPGPGPGTDRGRRAIDHALADSRRRRHEGDVPGGRAAGMARRGRGRVRSR